MHKAQVYAEIPKTQTSPVVEAQKADTFKPFSWARGSINTPSNQLLCMAKDVASGVALAMQMVEQSNNHRLEGDALLSVWQCGVFDRFAISACELLNKAIDQHFDQEYDRAEGGK